MNRTGHGIVRSQTLFFAKTVASRRRCLPGGCRDEYDSPRSDVGRPRTVAPRGHVAGIQIESSTMPVRLHDVRSDGDGSVSATDQPEGSKQYKQRGQHA